MINKENIYAIWGDSDVEWITSATQNNVGDILTSWRENYFKC